MQEVALSPSPLFEATGLYALGSTYSEGHRSIKREGAHPCFSCLLSPFKFRVDPHHQGIIENKALALIRASTTLDTHPSVVQLICLERLMCERGITACVNEFCMLFLPAALLAASKLTYADGWSSICKLFCAASRDGGLHARVVPPCGAAGCAARASAVGHAGRGQRRRALQLRQPRAPPAARLALPRARPRRCGPVPPVLL